ncbi:hypothetical protein BaRGS_00015779 [Batillaria attramentaria]|uniref:FHA domain-containing protein n=1 Tax=Batillaria attramentaria TaxID=370345 RepID=A0ABD0L0M3_9CAEN
MSTVLLVSLRQGEIINLELDSRRDMHLNGRPLEDHKTKPLDKTDDRIRVLRLAERPLCTAKSGKRADLQQTLQYKVRLQLLIRAGA